MECRLGLEVLDRSSQGVCLLSCVVTTKGVDSVLFIAWKSVRLEAVKECFIEPRSVDEKKCVSHERSRGVENKDICCLLILALVVFFCVC